eukprot:TRINITY_DN4404_c0_g1_i1.p1 TRINITY_DN4404_c0_g1~~TRINITY_DN4404_c0_g1_i1.p1  ORF type:complete len:864 (+),score=249.57 TRINITY_DN4404_c0_g1_i1:113-2704(+)
MAAPHLPAVGTFLLCLVVTVAVVQGVRVPRFEEQDGGWTRDGPPSYIKEDHPHDDLQRAFMDQGSMDTFAFVRNDVLPKPEHIANSPSLTFSKGDQGEFWTQAQGDLPTADKIDGIIVKLVEGTSALKAAAEAGMVSAGPLGDLRFYYVFKRQNKQETWPQVMAKLKANPAVLFATVDTENKMVEAGTLLAHSHVEIEAGSSTGKSSKGSDQPSVTVKKDTEDVDRDPEAVEAAAKAEQQKKEKFEVPKATGFHLQWHLVNDGTKKGQVRGEDANVFPAWRSGVSGKGVLVAVADVGVQSKHPDFAKRYNNKWAFDFGANTPGGDPLNTDKEVHGTACAGVIGASKDTSCSVGAAYQTDLTSYRILGKGMDAGKLAKALVHGLDSVAVHSHSWAYAKQNGKDLVSLSPVVQAAITKGSKQGRDGRGAIYVFAAGNHHKDTSSPDYDGLRSLRYVIPVAASDWAGKVSQYSEWGASVFISAPSSNVLWAKNGEGIFTSDPVGKDGKSKGDCRNNFGGTSSATPLVSGVIALMIEANSGLTQRDILEILARTAYRNDILDKDWKVNMAGLHINHKYGFGRIDGAMAVDLARRWIPLPEEKTVAQDAPIAKVLVPAGQGGKVLQRIGHNIIMETVNIYVDITCRNRGKLSIVVISPSGTRSVFWRPHRDTNANIRWTFRTNRLRGEKSKGTWQLIVFNGVGEPTLSINRFHIYAHGHFARDDFEKGVLLSAPLQGKLSVLCKTGKNILFGKKLHKIRLRASVGIQSYSFVANKAGPDPAWNKLALFNIRLTSDRTLKLRVFADKVAIGYVHIPLVAYFGRPNAAIPIKAKLGGGTMFGELDITLQFTPTPGTGPHALVPVRPVTGY